MMKLEPAGTRTILNPESKPLLACGRSISLAMNILIRIHWPTIDVQIQIGKKSNTSCTNTGPRVGSCRILSESPQATAVKKRPKDWRHAPWFGWSSVPWMLPSCKNFARFRHTSSIHLQKVDAECYIFRGSSHFCSSPTKCISGLRWIKMN